MDITQLQVTLGLKIQVRNRQTEIYLTCREVTRLGEEI